MKDHLTSALAQLNGSADWNKRTGGTLPAKLTCFEAQDVLIALQELQTRAERAEAALRALVGKVASTICDCEGAVAYIFEREPGDKYRVQVALDRAWQVCATIPIKKASK
jgi:hypothetical protein